MTCSDFIQACEDENEVNLSHFIVLSNQTILADYCKPPYKKDSLRLFFSMTKSIASLAIGIAYDMKLLTLEDPIASFFEQELPISQHENLRKIRIRHLLTMSSGIHDNTYTSLFTQDDWVRAFLAQDFPHEPGTFYRYSTHGSHMLSAIIHKASGLSLEHFLNKYLFHPMEIFEAQWECSPEGHTAGGMGLSLYPGSLAKIAQLLLNSGMYRGNRLISKEYLDQATVAHITKHGEVKAQEKPYSGTEYGFQFHICRDSYFRAEGAFGQLCLLCPSKNLAFIAFSQHSKMEKLLELIYKHFIDRSEPIVLDKYKPPIKEQLPSMPFTVADGRYAITENPLRITALEYAVDSCNTYSLNIFSAIGRNDSIFFDLSSCFTYGKGYFVKDLQWHVQEYACRARCLNASTLELDIYYIETPYVVKLTLSFEEKAIQLNFEINVSLTLSGFTATGFLSSAI